MHVARPWYRKSKKAYYVQVGRRQVRLGKTREEALQRFREIQVEQPTAKTYHRYSVAELCDLFLDWSHRHNILTTYKWYRMFVRSFAKRYGGMAADELKNFHATNWLDGHKKWLQAARRCAVVAIKRVFNWAVDEGRLTANPLKSLKKPPAKRREKVLNPDEWQKVWDAIRPKDPFRDFLMALRDTGARPSEITRVSSENISPDFSAWVLWEHKTAKRTGRPRVIYLTPTMVELTKRLAALYPSGPIFRSTRGFKTEENKGNRKVMGTKKPWTRNGLRCRFRNLRKKTGIKGLTAYCIRHSFTTSALERGVPIASVAELQGTSVRMIEQFYGHLSEKAEHLRAMAARATGA